MPSEERPATNRGILAFDEAAVKAVRDAVQLSANVSGDEYRVRVVIDRRGVTIQPELRIERESDLKRGGQ